MKRKRMIWTIWNNKSVKCTFWLSRNVYANEIWCTLVEFWKTPSADLHYVAGDPNACEFRDESFKIAPMWNEYIVIIYNL